jgi:hypothetical protein
MPFLLEIGIKAIVVLQRLSNLQDTDMFVCQLMQAGRLGGGGDCAMCMCVSGDCFLCVHYCPIVNSRYSVDKSPTLKTGTTKTTCPLPLTDSLWFRDMQIRSENSRSIIDRKKLLLL